MIDEGRLREMRAAMAATDNAEYVAALDELLAMRALFPAVEPLLRAKHSKKTGCDKSGCDAYQALAALDAARKETT